MSLYSYGLQMFGYTNEYYAVSGLNYLTRIGSLTYSSCTPVRAGGTVQGTVTDAGNSNPLSGATVMLGSRMTTTDGSGFYQTLNVPAGTYPSLTASYPGYALARPRTSPCQTRAPGRGLPAHGLGHQVLARPIRRRLTSGPGFRRTLIRPPARTT